MIYNYSVLDNQKHQKTLSRPLHSKLKKIQGLFKTVQTLEWFRTLYEALHEEHTIKNHNHRFDDFI